MEKTTFIDQEVVAFVTDNFQAYQIDGDSPKGKLLGEKYSILGYPTIVLLNSNGKLLYKTIGYSAPDRFMRNCRLGIADADSPTNLIKLEEHYRQMPTDLLALKDLITKRRYLDLDNRDLLDTLLTYLPTDSLTTVATLKLLMFCFTSGSEQSTIRSKGFLLLKDNAPLAKSTLESYNPLEYNQAMFNRANRSLTVAAETNDLSLFEDAIDIYLILNPQATATEGLKREKYLHQMRFYSQLGLVDKMVKASVNLCEDSLMHLGSEGLAQLAARYVSRGVVLDESLPYERKIALCRQDIANNMAHDLNEGAWSFYERVADRILLHQAITWSRQSLASVEVANYLDTLAHLLYKTGQFKEAIIYEDKAVRLAILKGENSSTYQKALEQMRTKNLKP